MIGTTATAVVPTIQKGNQYIGIQDGGYLVRFGMVEQLGFGMPYKIRTVQHSNNFGPFEIIRCLVFEVPAVLDKLVLKTEF